MKHQLWGQIPVGLQKFMNNSHTWYAQAFAAECTRGDYFQRFDSRRISPETLDALLADGWRHFGTGFFRDMLNMLDDALVVVLPLRIDVTRFTPSKSQRRVLAKNQDSVTTIAPAQVSAEFERIFTAHSQRFARNIPESLASLFSAEPSIVPCASIQFSVTVQNSTVAVSFVDVGRDSLSSVYAIFDPEFSERRLGIFTLLKEIELAQQLGKKYLYLGYAYREPSFYDYKKQFSGTEYYNWRGQWLDL